MAANYRAGCRGRSAAEFIAKLGTVLEEADESVFWLELIVEGQLLSAKRVEALISEGNELTSIFFAARRTLLRSKEKS